MGLFPLLNAALAAALLHPLGASRFRGASGEAGARPKQASRKPCAANATIVPHDAGALLQEETPSFADGYMRVACEVDKAPESERIYFKDHACGEVSSCRLLEQPMTTRMCFNFCRTQETAHFFGLVHGRDCYCATYFHAHSTGGQGECDRQCEDEADVALSASQEAADQSITTLDLANQTASSLRDLADAWHLGVCSVEPEGPRVCGLTSMLLTMAAKLTDVANPLSYTAGAMAGQVAELHSAKAMDDDNASTLSNMEMLTDEVLMVSGKVKGEVAVANNTLNAIAGPIGGLERPLETWAANYANMSVQAGWNAVCGLKMLPGKAYAAMAVGQQGACAARCMDLSISGGCVGFNYQEKDGFAACQMLGGDGVVEPKDSLLAKVPIFEVSDTKRDSLGLQSMGCFASHAFLAGHPRGPLKSTVIRSVTA